MSHGAFIKKHYEQTEVALQCGSTIDPALQKSVQQLSAMRIQIFGIADQK